MTKYIFIFLALFVGCKDGGYEAQRETYEEDPIVRIPTPVGPDYQDEAMSISEKAEQEFSENILIQYTGYNATKNQSSMTAFRHNSGDLVTLFSYYTNANAGGLLTFFLQDLDTQGVQAVRLVNVTTGQVAARGVCGGPMYCTVPAASLLKTAKCASRYVVHPAPGRYKVQATYTNGDVKSSYITFPAPCGWSTAQHAKPEKRTIASVSQVDHFAFSTVLPFLCFLAGFGLALGLRRLLRFRRR
jgi:hypothetical protein